MANLDLYNPENAINKHKRTFDQIENVFSSIINMFRVIGNSLAALESAMSRQYSLQANSED